MELADTRTMTWTQEGGSVSCVEWNRVGDCLASASVNSTVRLWNIDRPSVR